MHTTSIHFTYINLFIRLWWLQITKEKNHKKPRKTIEFLCNCIVPHCWIWIITRNNFIFSLRTVLCWYVRILYFQAHWQKIKICVHFSHFKTKTFIVEHKMCFFLVCCAYAYPRFHRWTKKNQKKRCYCHHSGLDQIECTRTLYARCSSYMCYYLLLFVYRKKYKKHPSRISVLLPRTSFTLFFLSNVFRWNHNAHGHTSIISRMDVHVKRF